MTLQYYLYPQNSDLVILQYLSVIKDKKVGGQLSILLTQHN